MSLKLSCTCQAGKFIKSLPPKQYKQVVSTVLSLLDNPEPHDSAHLLGTLKGNRRVDVGEYRIVYREESQTVLILVIGKRNGDEVYKLAKQSLNH